VTDIEKLRVYLDTSVVSLLLIEILNPSLLFRKRGVITSKPVLIPDFTIEDIHKSKKYNYYQTKDMSLQERIDYYNRRGMDIHKIIQRRKLLKRNSSLFLKCLLRG